MALRVKRIEQQMDALPAQWKQFAGKPMDMHYYGTKINTFRDNPELQPSKVYMRFAIKELKQQMSAYHRMLTGLHRTTISLSNRDGIKLSDTEVEEIIKQEWQTDLTRSVVEARLNRHRSKDGPVVRRCHCGQRVRPHMLQLSVHVNEDTVGGMPLLFSTLKKDHKRACMLSASTVGTALKPSLLSEYHGSVRRRGYVRVVGMHCSDQSSASTTSREKSYDTQAHDPLQFHNSRFCIIREFAPQHPHRPDLVFQAVFVVVVAPGHELPRAVRMTAPEKTPPPMNALPVRPASSSSPLMMASFDGHLDTVEKLLLQAGPEASAALVNEANGRGRTPLFMAAWSGHMEVVRSLLANGACVDARCVEGETPLFRAAARGHVDVVNALIVEYGACVDHRKENGLTPLSVASREGHAGVVRALLDHGAEVNQRSRDRQSPLRLAAQTGHLDVVKLLVDRGAAVDMKDICGETPLFDAVRGGHLEVVAELVRCGASITVASYSGRTPLSVASYKSNAGVVTDALTGNWRASGIIV